MYMLAGVYTGCACVGVSIVLLFLQQLPSQKEKSRCGGMRASCKPKIIVATFLQMKDYRQLLLIPLTMYSGLEQAFMTSDFTQACRMVLD